MLAKTFSFVQKFFFYILIAGIAVFVIFKASEIKYMFYLLLKGGPLWIALAIITQILTYVCNALTYKGVLKTFGHEKIITTRELMESSIVMLFLSKMIPSLGISNNWFFVDLMHKKGMPVKQAIQVVVLEVFSYYFSLIILLTTGLIYLFTHHELTKFLFRATIIGLVMMIAILILVGWLLGHKEQLHKTINWFKRHFGKFFSKEESLVHGKKFESANLESAVDIIKSKIHYLFWPTFWQATMFLLNAYTIYFLFKAFDFHVNFGIAMIGLVMAQVLSLISMVPSGIGVFEGGMILFYTNLDIPLEMTVIITLLFRGLSLFAPIPIGSYLYKKICDNNKMNCKKICGKTDKI